MRRLFSWERRWAACVLLSLLAHLLLLWGVNRWLNLEGPEQGFKAQLQPPERQPFKLKRRWALPPGKHAFAGRPSFRTSPRTLKGLSPGTAQEYLERGIPQGLVAQASSPEPYSSYQGSDTLLIHPEWEGLALQTWRDSLALPLESQTEWDGPQPL